MANRIAISTLNASTIDILNTIRANASLQYQSRVPVVESSVDIPKVGEIIYGYPALANEFISSLVTRIASVRIKSATFNNAYAELKKGYLEFGETVEEAFVQIAKAREFSAEKAASREFKRTIPDVRTAFHAMNWRVQYPITIQDEDLRTAFLDMNGVQDLIAKIVNSVTTANEYDEYLLFKYLMIKAITKGKMFPVSVDTTNIKNAAKKFRGISNNLTFMNTKYNAAGVHTTTQKDKQYIFMDSEFNATFDVDVLASAFNMDRADFIGKLKLIDKWDEFDNERFDVIREECDMLEEVTTEELSLMSNVIAVLVDDEWFQVYDNLYKMTEKYVAGGMYWNYFLNIWKTVSSSPFSNAVVFVSDEADITPLETITATVNGKSVSDTATIIELGIDESTFGIKSGSYNFEQTGELTENGVAVHRYGAYIFPTGAEGGEIILTVNGSTYRSGISITSDSEIGDEFELILGDPTLRGTAYIGNNTDGYEVKKNNNLVGMLSYSNTIQNAATFNGEAFDGRPNANPNFLIPVFYKDKGDSVAVEIVTDSLTVTPSNLATYFTVDDSGVKVKVDVGLPVNSEGTLSFKIVDENNISKLIETSFKVEQA